MENSNASNMRYYEQSRAVPAEAKKQFNNGRFSGTDINPMWRIKKLTEMFGPAGIGWYVDEVEERWEKLSEESWEKDDNGKWVKVGEATTIAIVNLKLYVKENGEWSKPIYGTGGNIVYSKGRPSDEGYKMAYTDALSVACKALGVGADVYFEKDKTKYTAATDAAPQKPAAKPAQTAPVSTADVQTAVSGEVAQEQLTALVEQYTRTLSQTEKRAFAAIIRQNNDNDVNFRNIPKPENRKALFDYITAHMSEPAEQSA